jgi:hypothetical protein
MTSSLRGTVRSPGAATALLAVLALLLSVLALTPAPAEGATRAKLIQRASTLNFEVSLAKFMTVYRGSKSALDSNFDWDDYDGCSAGTEGFRDFFRRACLRHDFGYRNFGKGLQLVSTGDQKKKIDVRFHTDMDNLCRNRLSGDAERECLIVSDGAYAASRNLGQFWTAFTGKRCISGKFCIFDDKRFEDRRAAMTASHSDLSKDGLGFGDKTSSAKNADNVSWVLYDDTGYSDRHLCFKPGATLADFDDHNFEDKPSSVRKMSGTACPSGSILIK